METQPQILGVQEHLDLVTPDDRWLVENLWEAEGSILFGGHTGTGKSQLAMSMAYDLALGRPLFGNPVWQPSKQNRVLYIDQENGKWIMKDRLEKRISISGDPVPSKDQLAIIHRAYGYPLDTSRGHRWMLDTCNSFAPDVVIVDSIKDSMEGSPNDADAATKFYHNLWDIRDQVKLPGSGMGITWVLVHHVNKTPRDKHTNEDYDARGMDLFRGARTWVDGASGGFLGWRLPEGMTQPGEWFRQRLYFIKVRATEALEATEARVLPGGKVLMVEEKSGAGRPTTPRPPGL